MSINAPQGQPENNLIETLKSDSPYIKKAWYYQSWFLSIIFALWFLVVPGIAGIVLLVLSILDDKAIARKVADLHQLAISYGAMDAEQKRNEIAELQNTVNSLHNKIELMNKDIADQQAQLEDLKKQLIITDEELLVQSFGLYSPKYEFTGSAEYKARLEVIRSQQKELIKSGNAATGNMNWAVDGNQSKGKKMVKDTQKLLLRAFNSECDEIINRVKYNNFEQSLKRITSSAEAISKLGSIMHISITTVYYKLKIEELTLAFEYQQKKQQEKEEQKALREQMREEAKLQREIEAERRKLEKEQNHYSTALSKILSQLETAGDDQKKSLLEKQREIEEKLAEIDKAVQDIDYREANQKAGYVYVVSNIGSFGVNVFKIGMTRRLDPQERIDEISDASVPFNFDIHAMIFSEDAPALEAALHRAFEDKKVNMVNTRREFFNVSLEDIKNVVTETYDKTVEFIDVPDAEQYRISQKMKQQMAG